MSLRLNDWKLNHFGSPRRIRRSSLLIVCLACAALLLATGCGGGGDTPEAAEENPGDTTPTTSAESREGATVVMLAIGPATVGGYNSSHTAGFNAMCEKYKFECTIADNVEYAAAAQTMTTLANRGTDVIIANSSGYAEALLEVAPKFPDTWFIMTSDMASTEDNANLAAFVQRWEEFGFLGGVVAGLITETGVTAHINGQPLLAAERMMNGWRQGLEHVRPGTEHIVQVTNSFTDTALANQAALAAIDRDADVLTGVAGGAAPGTIQAVQERNVNYIGYYADEHDSAPCCIPTSMIVKTDVVYDSVGSLFTSGELEPRIYVGSVAEGTIGLAPLRGVPESVIQEVEDIVEGVRSGEIEVEGEAAGDG